MLLSTQEVKALFRELIDVKENNILSIGQEVSVALISPIITVVEEEHKVEEQDLI